MISTSILPLILGIVSGICLGTGLIYLFIGLRRRGRDWVQLTFALFAISYGLAVATALLLYKAASVDEFLLITKVNGIFVGLTLISLLWFVAIYTHVRPRVFLSILTFFFALMAVLNVLRPVGLYDAILEMHVLLAIGDTDLRLSLELLLSEEDGIRIAGSVSDSGGLLALAQSSCPDLVLLDWELPGGPIQSVLGEIHALDCQPKIIALGRQPISKESALRAGADSYLTKGDPPEQLLVAFRALNA